MEARRTTKDYKEFDIIAMPEDVPEAGIRAGTKGAVVDVMPDGTLLADVVNEAGYTIDMIYIAPESKLRVVGCWHTGEDKPTV